MIQKVVIPLANYTCKSNKNTVSPVKRKINREDNFFAEKELAIKSMKIVNNGTGIFNNGFNLKK
jgi:hypothetical protein